MRCWHVFDVDDMEVPLRVWFNIVHFVDGSSSLPGSRFYCPPSSFWRVHWFYAFVMAVEIDVPLLHLCHGRGPLTQQHTERMELQNKKIVAKPMMKNQSQCSQSESLVKTFSEYGGFSKKSKRRKRRERKEAMVMRISEGHSDKPNSEGWKNNHRKVRAKHRLKWTQNLKGLPIYPIAENS